MPESTAVKALLGVVDGIDWLQETHRARQVEVCRLAKLHRQATSQAAKKRLEEVIADHVARESRWSRTLQICAAVRETLAGEGHVPPQDAAAPPGPQTKRELAKLATILAGHLAIVKLRT